MPRLLGRVFIVTALLGLALVSAHAEDKKEEAKPEVGKPAPAIDLPATSIQTVLPKADKDKKTLSLADLKDKNVVLFFYPKALTGG